MYAAEGKSAAAFSVREASRAACLAISWLAVYAKRLPVALIGLVHVDRVARRQIEAAELHNAASRERTPAPAGNRASKTTDRLQVLFISRIPASIVRKSSSSGLENTGPQIP
jgi:hypothetical protein